MADIHTFTPPPRSARRTWPELDLASETIRRGVQYLAFRARPSGLQASYEPGPGHVNGHVARAARAALRAHEDLGRDLSSDLPAGRRSAAVALRRRFAEQLAEVKSGVTRAPATALRSAYLDALATVMIEAVRRDGLAALEAWTAAHDG